MHQQLLLIGAVTAVGVLHTVVPDHWAPIAVLARQRGWSRAQTARAAFVAGLGHTLSTLAIGLIVWFAGVVAARHFGRAVSLASSIALIAFGLWIAVASLRELREEEPRPDVREKTPRMALLLLFGSSPMVEGIPAFFAAAKDGAGLLAVMSVCFAVSTIVTYVVLCVWSGAALKRLNLGSLERYGEVLSGAVIAAIGVIFLALS